MPFKVKRTKKAICRGVKKFKQMKASWKNSCRVQRLPHNQMQTLVLYSKEEIEDHNQKFWQVTLPGYWNSSLRWQILDFYGHGVRKSQQLPQNALGWKGLLQCIWCKPLAVSRAVSCRWIAEAATGSEKSKDTNGHSLLNVKKGAAGRFCLRDKLIRPGTS